MRKFLFLLFVAVVNIYSANLQWDHQHRYTLKKDEIANISISTTESKGESVTEFYLRWTLIVQDRVTTLVKYKNHPYQMVLYKKRSLDSATFPLLPTGSNEMNDLTYLMLVLSDINQGKEEVIFDIFIKDKKKRVLVDFNLPEEK